MKNARKILAVLLAFMLCFAMFSCGGDGGDTCAAEHTDGDGDKICDVCKENIPEEKPELSLIENGAAKFKLVLANGSSPEVIAAVNDNIVGALSEKFGITVSATVEGAEDDAAQACEVLVGNVTSRGEPYKYNTITLGYDGYMIDIVESKVRILAGSDEALIYALEIFADNILGLDSDSLTSVKITTDDTVFKPVTDYKVTSISVGGGNIAGTAIATDLSNDYYVKAAEVLRNVIYERAGLWLEIVDSAAPNSSSVIFKHVDKSTVSGEDTYSVAVVDGKLVISCAYDNMLESATSSFTAQKLVLATGDVNFTGEVYKQDISVVYYEDFGAKGNGTANDFAAIYYTHEFANECGQTVVAKANARYYIGDTRFILEGAEAVTNQIVSIQTNVIWTGAEFIIDDTEIGPVPDTEYYSIYDKPIFNIIPDDDLAPIVIDGKDESGAQDQAELAILAAIVEAGLNRDTVNIQLDVGYDGPLMLIPYNNAHKVYRRQGYGGYAGEAMHEVIVIDENGNVSKETPIMFDYTSLSYITVYKLDESRAITVDGGTFTTKVSNVNTVYTTSTGAVSYYGGYIRRNIIINRSYTTLKNVKHYITGDVPLTDQIDENGKIIHVTGCYNGFFSASEANHVTLKDCTLTGRRCYQRPKSDGSAGGGTGGTYDFSAVAVNKIVLDKCTQSNFWVTVNDGKINVADENTAGAIPSMTSVEVNGASLQLHWGIGGTNYCKNMEYINGCLLSRFDAHQGLYNGKIEDSTVNYMAITGNGTFEVTNTTFYASGTGYGSNSLFHLRADYGSTWEGDIIVNGLRAYVYTTVDTYLIYRSYTNWYFGYTACLPSLSINDLDYYDINTRKPLAAEHEILLLSGITSSSKIHLLESDNVAWLNIIDSNGDKYIDEPLYDRNLDGKIDDKDLFDLDGNGIPGETSYKYADILNELKNNGGDYRDGYQTSFHDNLNIIRPPEYVKIVGNDGVDTDGDGEGDGGYVFIIPDTSANDEDDISDGNYWDNIETWGGFFGDTKFIYGEGEDDYLHVTEYTKRDKTNTFRFE